MSTQKRVAPAVSMNDISKINLQPFTGAKDLAWRTRSANVKKKDNVGFMTVTSKKPRSLRPYEPTLQRVKWSKEVVKMPPLDNRNKATSTALVGGSLSYTKTSHWCSSSSNYYGNMLLSAIGEEDDRYMLPESTGEAIAQRLHQGIVVRICTNESYKRAKSSPRQNSVNDDLALDHVPLCFDDELERKSVKVLTARPPTVYTPLPIVSETYPLINSTDQETFGSLRFHSLDLPKPLSHNSSVLRSKTHPTIIKPTDSVQKAHMLCSLRHSQRGEGVLCPSQSGHKIHRTRSVRVLTADGNLTKYSIDGPLFLNGHDVKPSSVMFTNTGKSPQVPFLMSRQKSITKIPVGPVVNGINPKQDAERSPSDDLKTVYKMNRGKLVHSSHVTPPQFQRGVARQNGNDFIVISKPLKSNQSHVAEQQFNEEIGPREIANVSDNYGMSQGTDDENLGLNEINFSLSGTNSSVDHISQDGAPGMRTVEVLHSLNAVNDSNTCTKTVGSVNDPETPQPNPHLQWSCAINIPTAESYE